MTATGTATRFWAHLFTTTARVSVDAAAVKNAAKENVKEKSTADAVATDTITLK